jgi:uncharacterized protein with HEPN domain
MRSSELYLRDIVEAGQDVVDFIGDNSEETFKASDLLMSAVQMKLAIMGEAPAHVSKDLRDKHPEIPWKRVAAYRNFAIHAYFGVAPTIVWETATKHAAATRDLVNAMLAAEFPS